MTFDSVQHLKDYFEVVGDLAEKIFKGAYLCGSQQDGTANHNSDLDLIYVLASEPDEDLKLSFLRLHKEFNSRHSTPVEFIVMSLHELKALPAYAKFAESIWGEDPFKKIPLESMEAATDRYVYGALRLMKVFLRGDKGKLESPLRLPEEGARFHGYALEKKAYGWSIKRLMSATARICSAIHCIHGQAQPRSKRESLNLIDWLTQTASDQWHYALPAGDEALEELKLHLIKFHQLELCYLKELDRFFKGELPAHPSQSLIRRCSELLII